MRPGVEQTDWYLDGKHYHVSSGESLDFFERKLKSELLSPVPSEDDLDPQKMRFDRKEETVGGAKLPCVMVIRKLKLEGQNSTFPMGMFPTYCFEPQQPMIRAFFAFGSTSVIFNKITRVQGKYLPRQLSIFDRNLRVLTANVDVVEALSPASPELKPRDSAAELKGPEKAELSGAVAQGALLKQTRPNYPQDAKDAHIQGKVTLRALIGRDGRIHDLSVIEGPSPSLIAASMWAVSQWEYRPYLVNGEPVEVDTTINVVFRLGFQ